MPRNPAIQAISGIFWLDLSLVQLTGSFVPAASSLPTMSFDVDWLPMGARIIRTGSYNDMFYTQRRISLLSANSTRPWQPMNGWRRSCCRYLTESGLRDSLIDLATVKPYGLLPKKDINFGQVLIFDEQGANVCLENHGASIARYSEGLFRR